jgi:hypothetical protein
MLNRLVCGAVLLGLGGCATVSEANSAPYVYARVDAGGSQHLLDQQGCRDSYEPVSFASAGAAAAGLGLGGALAVGIASGLVKGALDMDARVTHSRKCMAAKGYQRVSITEEQSRAYAEAQDKAAWLEANLPDHVGREEATAKAGARPSGKTIIVRRF